MHIQDSGGDEFRIGYIARSAGGGRDEACDFGGGGDWGIDWDDAGVVGGRGLCVGAGREVGGVSGGVDAGEAQRRGDGAGEGGGGGCGGGGCVVDCYQDVSVGGGAGCGARGTAMRGAVAEWRGPCGCVAGAIWGCERGAGDDYVGDGDGCAGEIRAAVAGGAVEFGGEWRGDSWGDC